MNPIEDRRHTALVDQFGSAVRLNDSLARYTVARLGGSADAVIMADSREMLFDIVRVCRDLDLPLRIIGGGANILFSDRGFRGVIIVNHSKGVIIENDGTIQADSGVGLITLTRETIGRGLSGFEWAIGVPGTVGGAVVNNAGAHGRAMADSVQSIDLAVESGSDMIVERWPIEQLAYGYRESVLKGDSVQRVVLSAILHTDPGHDPAELRARVEGYSAHRKQTQPPGASLGSMFKNPPGDYAGRLIEAAGLKGSQVGGVQISPVHANFFVNTGGGTASDYLALIDRAQREVRRQFGVDLHLEIEVIGESDAAKSQLTQG